MKEFYCFCVFFSVYYAKEADVIFSSPLAAKFYTKTKKGRPLSSGQNFVLRLRVL